MIKTMGAKNAANVEPELIDIWQKITNLAHQDQRRFFPHVRSQKHCTNVSRVESCTKLLTLSKRLNVNHIRFQNGSFVEPLYNFCNRCRNLSKHSKHCLAIVASREAILLGSDIDIDYRHQIAIDCPECSCYFFPHCLRFGVIDLGISFLAQWFRSTGAVITTSN